MLAKHLRDVHDTSEYASLRDGLRKVGVGLCGTCHTARPVTRAGGITRHKCTAPVREEEEQREEEAETEEGQGDLP
jgi:hypothetical protein